MPDLSFESLDKVPEGLREYAKEDGGKVVVKVVPAVKLDEFRTNNINLAKERDSYKANLEKVLPVLGGDVGKFDEFQAELQALREVNQKVKDGKLTAKDDIDAEVGRRVASMKSDFERQLTEKAQEVGAWKTKASEADQKYRRSVVDRMVTDAVLNEKSGADPRALQDILSRSYGVFVVKDDGKIEARDGEAVIYGADGATPMTPLEWLGKLKSEAPYFFKNSSGGGAAGNQGGNTIAGMSREDFQKLPATERLRLARQYNL